MDMNRKRLELEAHNRLGENDLKQDIIDNKELALTLKKDEELNKFDEDVFNKSIEIIESLTKSKIKEYEDLNKRLKEFDGKALEEPVFKIEFEKNGELKKKIEKLEKENLVLVTKIEELDLTNEFLQNKKDDIVSQRKKLIQVNEDLKREIEAKKQLNEIRIQKKVKENNSIEIKKLEEHLNSIKEKIIGFEEKIKNEVEKIKILMTDIIRLNLDLKEKNEKRDQLMKIGDEKLAHIRNLKDHLEEIKNKYFEIKTKVNCFLKNLARKGTN